VSFDFADFNRQVIEEFRANGGRVAGNFGGVEEGATLLLLHTTGARTGKPRLHPLAYLPHGDAFVVFASKAGAPTNPDWYHNLRASPRTRIEVGSEVLQVVARVAEGEERERLWTAQKERMPYFAKYERRTTRRIPVVVLERA